MAADDERTVTIRTDLATARRLRVFLEQDTELRAAGGVRVHLSEPRPPQGFAQVLPPELIIAFAKGLAGAIGTGMGKLLWEKVRQFFALEEQKGATDTSQPLVIESNGSEVSIDKKAVPDAPPQPLADLS